jgi:hypothetical protein
MNGNYKGARRKFVNAPLSSASFGKGKDRHGDGLREFSLEIPARPIAAVRKQCVDADTGLLRLHWVNAVFRFVSFFVDGENPQRRDGFKRVAGLRMHHAYANGNEVANVNDGNDHNECNQNELRECSDRGQTKISSR